MPLTGFAGSRSDRVASVGAAGARSVLEWECEGWDKHTFRGNRHIRVWSEGLGAGAHLQAQAGPDQIQSHTALSLVAQEGKA